MTARRKVGRVVSTGKSKAVGAGADKSTRKKSSTTRGGEALGRKTRGAGGDELGRIRDLLQLMKDHEVEELEIGPDGTSLRISKRSSLPTMMQGIAPMPMQAPAHAPGPPAAASGPAAVEAEDPDLIRFTSPMVGTFYRKPSPEADDYVVEGDMVQEDTTLGIIEAMKVFNEIKAELRGKVEQILVDNGEAVEYGQPLFLIRKS